MPRFCFGRKRLHPCYNQAMKNSPLKVAEIKDLAERLVEDVKNSSNTHATVVGLYGDLGAGKTTFMQFFGQALGVKDTILSPTFVIEKIYKIDQDKFDHLIHIDAYRLDSPKELETLGWAGILENPRNIICVEWADKIENLLPEKTFRLRFSHHDEDSRVVEIEK